MEMLLKVSEPLSEHSDPSLFQNFPSRERSQQGIGMFGRASERYVTEAAELLGLSDVRTAATPCVTDRKKRAPGTDDDLLYRSIVGKLLRVQEDDAEACHDTKELAKQLSRQMATPQQSGLASAKHLVRYLQGHLDTLLRIQPQWGEATVCTYVDSDWAGCHETAKSTDAVVSSAAGCMVMLWPKTQALVAQSQAEAEQAAVLTTTSKDLARHRLRIRVLSDEPVM